MPPPSPVEPVFVDSVINSVEPPKDSTWVIGEHLLKKGCNPGDQGMPEGLVGKGVVRTVVTEVRVT